MTVLVCCAYYFDSSSHTELDILSQFVAYNLLFAGFARLTTESDKNHPPIRWVLPAGMPARSLSGVFTLDWINRLTVHRVISAASSGGKKSSFVSFSEKVH